MSPRAAGIAAVLIAVALVAWAAAAAAQSGPSGPQVQRSTDGVAGRTVVAWSAPFAQFQASRARPSDCARGQRGLVLFIPASRGPNGRTSCTAAAGQAVMFTPAAVICTEPNRGFCTDTSRINDVRRVRVSIDGAPVTIRRFDWVSRQAFRVGDVQAAVAGYMYIVTGLAPGRHEIVADATFRNPTERFRMTAAVTVR